MQDADLKVCVYIECDIECMQYTLYVECMQDAAAHMTPLQRIQHGIDEAVRNVENYYTNRCVYIYIYIMTTLIITIV